MAEPKLSVILATDTYATIRPVTDRLRKQTARREIEVVLIAPTAADVEPILAHQAEFACVRIVVSPVGDLAVARAAGIRAASAPAVFVGETHSYPHPEFAEKLLRALDSGYAAVAPGFGNGNPNGVLSWAGFLSDYGRWVHTLPAGEIPEVPLYNAVYRREILLELGERLVPALSHGDELPRHMRARGLRCYFEPAARLDHVNIARGGDWIRERFVSGLLIASYRVRRWGLARRLLYVGGSVLIPFVLMARVVPGIRKTAGAMELPSGTLAAIVFGMFVKGSGELAGYAGGPTEKGERDMWKYEMHKLAYAGPGPS
ncbi:MAG: glycosyltransferase [Bryobacterales bacterium]|nr:glycosyltransferase [Bryobacterales bacterium]